MSGGGGTTQNTIQQSESGPPAFLQPYLKGAIGDLSTYYAQHPNAPTYYTGETVAPLSTQSQGAVDMASGLAGNNGTLTAGNSSLTKFLNGSYVDPNTNPDFQGAIRAAIAPVTDNLMKNVIPGVTSQFAGSGRSGGSGLQQDATQQALTNYDRSVTDAATTAGSNYYTTALNQMLQANGLVPASSAANWQNIAGLAAAGNTVDQQRQAQDSSNKAAYDYNSNAQMNYISQYLSMLNGGYPGGTNTSTGNGQAAQQTDGTSSAIGSGMGLAAMALMAFSDERLKEDISEPIGVTFEGIPIRRWRYKGDPTPHVGFVAQEVAEHRPDAVAVHPSGYLMVDHNKATEARGLF